MNVGKSNQVALPEKISKIVQAKMAENTKAVSKDISKAQDFHLAQRLSVPFLKKDGWREKVASHRTFDKKNGTFFMGRTEDGEDEHYRVQRGNNRKELRFFNIKVQLKTAVKGFLFGKVNATAMTQVKDRKEDTDADRESKDVKSLYVCSYINGDQTIIQLENLKSQKVLATCILEEQGGQPGVRCMRSIGKSRVIGIYGSRVFCIKIKNYQFNSVSFLDYSDVKILDNHKKSDQVVLVFNNGDVKIGQIVKKEWVEVADFHPDFKEEISSVEFRRRNFIMFGYQNGKIVGYENMDQDWQVYKEFFQHDLPIESVRTWSKKGGIAVASDSEHITIVKPHQPPVNVKLASKDNPDELSINKKIIYMKLKKNGNLIYACSDGTTGKIKKLFQK